MMHATVRGLSALGLLVLLLWTGNAHAVPCQNNLPASNPDSVYTDHGNGTVTDTRTGLMWKQCAEGLSGATCQTGSVRFFLWADALADAEASTFASYTDWRLPNVKELSSLVEDCRVSPSINTNRFPNTPGVGFWSSSPRAAGAWQVGFNYGGAYGSPRTNSHIGRVRLVRGDSRFAGRWIGVATVGTSAYDYQWDLAQNGTDVTGTILIADPNGPNMALYRMRGTINGDSITFEGTSFIENSNSSTFCMASGSVTLSGAADNIELTGVWGPLAIPGGCPVGSSGGIQLRKVLW